MKLIFTTKLPPIIDTNEVLFGGWSDIRSAKGKLFRYAFIDRGSFVDIAIQTPRSPRGEHEDNNFHLTHKLPLKKDSEIMKICFHSGKEPKTLEQARLALLDFVYLYANWLDSGKSIDDQLAEMRN